MFRIKISPEIQKSSFKIFVTKTSQIMGPLRALKASAKFLLVVSEIA